MLLFSCNLTKIIYKVPNDLRGQALGCLNAPKHVAASLEVKISLKIRPIILFKIGKKNPWVLGFCISNLNPVHCFLGPSLQCQPAAEVPVYLSLPQSTTDGLNHTLQAPRSDAGEKKWVKTRAHPQQQKKTSPKLRECWSLKGAALSLKQSCNYPPVSWYRYKQDEQSQY